MYMYCTFMSPSFSTRAGRQPEVDFLPNTSALWASSETISNLAFITWGEGKGEGERGRGRGEGGGGRQRGRERERERGREFWEGTVRWREVARRREEKKEERRKMYSHMTCL